MADIRVVSCEVSARRQIPAQSKRRQDRPSPMPAYQVEADLTLLKWMVGFNLAVSVAALIKLLVLMASSGTGGQLHELRI